MTERKHMIKDEFLGNDDSFNILCTCGEDFSTDIYGIGLPTNTPIVDLVVEYQTHLEDHRGE